MCGPGEAPHPAINETRDARKCDNPRNGLRIWFQSAVCAQKSGPHPALCHETGDRCGCHTLRGVGKNHEEIRPFRGCRVSPVVSRSKPPLGGRGGPPPKMPHAGRSADFLICDPPSLPRSAAPGSQIGVSHCASQFRIASRGASALLARLLARFQHESMPRGFRAGLRVPRF